MTIAYQVERSEQQLMRLMANKRTAELVLKNRSEGRRDTPASETSSSSKVSESQGTPRTQVDFQFLNFSHPSDAKATGARKTVRSHVTKQQHQKEHKLQQERRTKSYQGTSSGAEQPSVPQRPHAETFPRERPTTLELEVHHSAAPSLSNSPETLSASASQSPAASPSHASERRPDLYGRYPEAWLPYVPYALDAYLSNMAAVVPNLDPNDVRERLRSFVMTDPALFHTVMLVAFCQYRTAHGARALPVDILQLLDMAMHELHRGIKDPVRQSSDELIAAVAHMAWYEALSGDWTKFHTHMAGLLDVVGTRGGLAMLGMSGILERILLWIDANAAPLRGAPVYFVHAAFRTSAVHPSPDPRAFKRGIA